MSRNLIERYWAAQDPYDPAALSEIRHPAWSADWPQSEERIPSHAADEAIHSTYPGYPAHRLERVAGSDELWRVLPGSLMSAPVRISGGSDVWVIVTRLEYPDGGLWDAIISIELRDGLVGLETVYYCRADTTMPWPAGYPDASPAQSAVFAASMEHDSNAEQRHRDAYTSYVDLATSDPVAAAHFLFDEGAVIDRPQYGQRVTGLAAIAQAHRDQELLLPGRVRRVIASGDILLTESRLSPAGSAWFLVGVLEFEGGKVLRATEYLAECFEAPDWRRPWVQPIEA